jgi:hypothetical protein
MWSHATQNGALPFFAPPPTTATTTTPASQQTVTAAGGQQQSILITPVTPPPSAPVSAATNGASASASVRAGAAQSAAPAGFEVIGRILNEISSALLPVFVELEINDQAIRDLLESDSTPENDSAPALKQYPTLRHHLTEALKDSPVKLPFAFIQRFIQKAKDSVLHPSRANANASN